MAEGKQVDLTAKLPDEILMEVFDRLPSLCSKLRLESVNHRFQHCLVQLLSAKPIPLEIDVADANLNGYDVPPKQLPSAVRALANKAKFSSIDYIDSNHYLFNSILSALVSSDNDCLEKVTKLQVESMSSDSVSEALLTEAFGKCTKLTDVLLDLPNDDMKNLGLALKEKNLTQLSVVLQRFYNQQDLIDLYQPIKPNMLKKIELSLFSMAMDVDLLEMELYGGAWAAVEEMDLHFTGGNIQMDKLFSSLHNLPALRKCTFLLRQTLTLDQLVAALTSLFTNEIEIAVLFDMVTRHQTGGCELVSVIRRVQAVHPDLRVDFVIGDGDPIDQLILTLGKVSFRQELAKLWIIDCADCGIFYPTLIPLLKTRAEARVYGRQQDVHLANARLDRCRIDTVVADLNRDGDLEFLKALHAEMNEAQTLATITFESKSTGQFQITVDCGHCLTNGCFGCIVG